jgi:hypothetical protein
MSHVKIGERKFSDNRWTLHRHTRENGSGFFSLCNFGGSGVTDYPVFHYGSMTCLDRVAYDRPESIPQSVQDWTHKKIEQYLK